MGFAGLGETEVAVGEGHRMTGYYGVVLCGNFGEEADGLVDVAP